MAKIGQGQLGANFRRIPDEFYRAIMPQSQAISQMVPGDIGTMSPEQHSQLMRGNQARIARVPIRAPERGIER